MAELPDSGLNKKIQDSAALAKEADALDAEVAELRNAYEQFFLGIERKPRAEVSRDAITDRDQVVALAARDSLPSGRPLRPSDLMRPELVQRNDIVTLTYDMPGLSLTVRGKATEGGAKGDTITVLNEQSKRMLQGVVVGPGRVAVITGTDRLAANLPQISGGAR